MGERVEGLVEVPLCALTTTACDCVAFISWVRLVCRHFTTVGVHENIALAMYAIDSLRQLSIKFLHKDELRDFNFQRLFLKVI
jgi:Sec7-like guanine-nucleotide exchange factor